MPALSNGRHELFAQALAQGKTADDAYVSAGYKRSRPAASRLSTNVNVKLRLAELQSRASAKTEVSLQWLLDQAIEVLNLAKENNQTGPAVAAIKELGVLSGHRVEKRENSHRTMNDMSDDELARIALGRSEGDSASSIGSTLSH